MLMMSQPAVAPKSHLIEDFSDRALGSLVGQGWSTLDGSSNINWTVEADSGSLSGRRTLIDKTTSDATRRLTMDKAGTVTDVEVLTRIKFTETANFDNGQISVRAGTGTGVFCGINGAAFSGTTDDNKFRMSRITGGGSGYTMIDQQNFTHSVDVWYWVRLRASGTTFSAKIWAHGEAEPAFDVSGVDASAPASGLVGIGCYDANDNYVFDYFAVALGGATAPFPAG